MGTKEVTVELPEDIIAWLKQAAEQDNITATNALIKAVTRDHYIRAELANGSRLLIERPDGELYALILGGI